METYSVVYLRYNDTPDYNSVSSLAGIHRTLEGARAALDPSLLQYERMIGDEYHYGYAHIKVKMVED